MSFFVGANLAFLPMFVKFRKSVIPALDWFAAEPYGGRGPKQASEPFPLRFNKAPRKGYSLLTFKGFSFPVLQHQKASLLPVKISSSKTEK